MPCILTRCRAFILPGYNTAPNKRLQRVLCSKCNYTAHAIKPFTGLYKGFSCNCTRSTAHDTIPIQQAIAPPATRWSAYQRPDALHRYQIPPPRRDVAQGSETAYYIIRYIRGQTMPAAAGQLLPCADRWQVLAHCQQYRPGAPAEGSASPPAQSQPGGWRSGTGSAVMAGLGTPAAGGAWRAARNHWRLPPHLFSSFRPIANRGQQ